mmetsp:Transcript_22661/g.57404  ORF Transcript_22661/g.57404 Transcript_22661/m.57404 type:complete len:370 (+) Transcript_22661:296-1405(+)
MGGRGGINILGEKKWHVWRMDNRLRVERDERQAAEQEEQQRREENSSRLQDRIRLLKNKRTGGSGAGRAGDLRGGDVLEDEVPESGTARHTVGAGASSSSSSSTAQLQQGAAGAAVSSSSSKYVNLFQEEENAWKQAEAEKNKKLDLQARGRVLARKGTLQGAVLRTDAASIADIKKEKTPWYMDMGGTSKKGKGAGSNYGTGSSGTSVNASSSSVLRVGDIAASSGQASGDSCTLGKRKRDNDVVRSRSRSSNARRSRSRDTSSSSSTSSSHRKKRKRSRKDGQEKDDHARSRSRSRGAEKKSKKKRKKSKKSKSSKRNKSDGVFDLDLRNLKSHSQLKAEQQAREELEKERADYLMHKTNKRTRNYF